MSNEDVHLPALITEHFGGTRSDARRMLAQGAVSLDGVVLTAAEMDLPREALDGRLLQLGKRRARQL